MVVLKTLPAIACRANCCGGRLVVKAVGVGVKSGDGQIARSVIDLDRSSVVVGITFKLLFDVQVEVRKWLTICDRAAGCIGVGLAKSGISRCVGLRNIITREKALPAIAYVV